MVASEETCVRTEPPELRAAEVHESERSPHLDQCELPFGELRFCDEGDVEWLAEGLDERARGAEPGVEDAELAPGVIEPVLAGRSKEERSPARAVDAEEWPVDARDWELALVEIRRRSRM